MIPRPYQPDTTIDMVQERFLQNSTDTFMKRIPRELTENIAHNDRDIDTLKNIIDTCMDHFATLGANLMVIDNVN